MVEFLVLDRDFPRALHYCIGCANESLHAISGTRIGYFQYRCEQLMGQLLAELNYTTTDALIQAGLHEYLDGLQSKMNEIDTVLRSEFISRNGVQAQTQAQHS